jgi:hypothetical protein
VLLGSWECAGATFIVWRTESDVEHIGRQAQTRFAVATPGRHTTMTSGIIGIEQVTR